MYLITNSANLIVEICEHPCYVRKQANGVVVLSEQDKADAIYSNDSNTFWPTQQVGYHCMNEDWTNKGGWLACDMRRYLNEDVIALLPDELVAAIKPRKFGKEEDKLWLFSEMEVFGDHDWTENDPDRGFQFEYFKDRRNRIKVDEDGDASWWWERSPFGSTSGNFCVVSSGGNANFSYAYGASGVCFGFYI